MEMKPTNTYKQWRVSYVLYIVLLPHVDVPVTPVATLREVSTKHLSQTLPEPMQM